MLFYSVAFVTLQAKRVEQVRHVKIYYHFFALNYTQSFCSRSAFVEFFFFVLFLYDVCNDVSAVVAPFHSILTWIATCTTAREKNRAYKSNLVSPLREEKLEHINNDFGIMCNKRSIISISVQEDILTNRTAAVFVTVSMRMKTVNNKWQIYAPQFEQFHKWVSMLRISYSEYAFHF